MPNQYHVQVTYRSSFSQEDTYYDTVDEEELRRIKEQYNDERVQRIAINGASGYFVAEKSQIRTMKISPVEPPF